MDKNSTARASHIMAIYSTVSSQREGHEQIIAFQYYTGSVPIYMIRISYLSCDIVLDTSCLRIFFNPLTHSTI